MVDAQLLFTILRRWRRSSDQAVSRRRVSFTLSLLLLFIPLIMLERRSPFISIEFIVARGLFQSLSKWKRVPRLNVRSSGKSTSRSHFPQLRIFSKYHVYVRISRRRDTLSLIKSSCSTFYWLHLYRRNIRLKACLV